MQLNTKSIKSRFEKSMDKYDENAIVQIALAQKLIDETAKIRKDFNSILELGCGTGILTKQIKEKLVFNTYAANDLVEKSKNYISKIIPNSTFLHGNALKLKPSKKVDLIVSNAMFQWFSDLSIIAEHCKNNLNTDGILAFSTFGPENFNELKDLSGLSLNYLTKDEIGKILSDNFEVLYSEEYIQTLEFESPLALLAHMKNTGVNSLTSKIWTVKEVKEFCEKYMAKYDTARLTYHPIIVVAKLK